MGDPNAVDNGREIGIDPNYWRDYTLLRLGITPDVAAGMPADELDWLLVIHREVTAKERRST